MSRGSKSLVLILILIPIIVLGVLGLRTIIYSAEYGYNYTNLITTNGIETEKYLILMKDSVISYQMAGILLILLGICISYLFKDLFYTK